MVVRRVVLPALSRPSRRMEYSVGRLLAEGKGAEKMVSCHEGRQKRLNAMWGGRRKGIGGDLPSLDVAQKYTLLARWYILAGGSVLWEVCAGAAA